MVVGVPADHRHVAAPRRLDFRIGRQLDEIPAEHPGRYNDFMSIWIVDHSLDQTVERRLLVQHLLEQRWLVGQERPGAVQRDRNTQRVRLDVVAMLLQRRLGGGQACIQRGADAVVEPGLDAQVEERRREHRHHDGRRDRNHAEHQHQADMQARPGGPAPPLHPNLGQPPGHHRAQQQQHCRTRQDGREYHVRPQRDRRAAGQQHERPDRQQQRNRRQY